MGCWPNRIVSTCPHWIPPHRCDFLTHFSLASGCLTELQNTSPNNKGNNDSNNSSRRKKRLMQSVREEIRTLRLGTRGREECCNWQESRLSLKRFFRPVYKRTQKYPTWGYLWACLPRWLHCQHERQRFLKTKTAHTQETHSYTARWNQA